MPVNARQMHHWPILSLVSEDLTHDAKWTVNFLDIPGLFRIATAICRDITDPYLKAAIMELYSDMVILPAFSNSDRMTKRNIEPLALERIITLACNACSACCGEEMEKLEITEEMVGECQPFNYLCMAAKQSNDNAAYFYRTAYKPACIQCDQECTGYLWEIDFEKCIESGGVYSANVTQINI